MLNCNKRGAASGLRGIKHVTRRTSAAPTSTGQPREAHTRPPNSAGSPGGVVAAVVDDVAGRVDDRVAVGRLDDEVVVLAGRRAREAVAVVAVEAAAVARRRRGVVVVAHAARRPRRPRRPLPRRRPDDGPGAGSRPPRRRRRLVEVLAEGAREARAVGGAGPRTERAAAAHGPGRRRRRQPREARGHLVGVRVARPRRRAGPAVAPLPLVEPLGALERRQPRRHADGTRRHLLVVRELEGPPHGPAHADHVQLQRGLPTTVARAASSIQILVSKRAYRI